MGRHLFGCTICYPKIHSPSQISAFGYCIFKDLDHICNCCRAGRKGKLYMLSELWLPMTRTSMLSRRGGQATWLATWIVGMGMTVKTWKALTIRRGEVSLRPGFMKNARLGVIDWGNLLPPKSTPEIKEDCKQSIYFRSKQLKILWMTWIFRMHPANIASKHTLNLIKCMLHKSGRLGYLVSQSLNKAYNG